MRAWFITAAGVFFLQACTVDANYAGVGFACSDVERCQAGLACVSGTCQLDPNATDASVGPDADSDCLPLIALSDEFSGNGLNARWTENTGNGTSVNVGGGVVSLVATTANPARFARIRSDLFAMDGKRVFAELPMMVNTSTEAIGEMRVGTTNQDYFFVRQSLGTLEFGSSEGGTENTVTMTPYLPNDHRWWQFRKIGGRVYADVSGDGSAWGSLESAAADVIIGDLYVEFQAGTRGNVADPGQMQVDNVNAGSGLCP